MAARMGRIRPLVAAKWLHESIMERKPALRVLETSFAAPGKGLESYNEKHIPSAAFFDLWRGCHPTQYESKPRHDPASFQDYARSLGIKADQHLVIYDKGSLYFAARLWFTFKHFGHPSVSVLNGGFPSWVDQGFSVETGPDNQRYETGDFTVNLNAAQFVNFADVNKKLKDLNQQIVDVRKIGHFRGEEEEPSSNTISALEAAGFPAPDHLLAGHIPGSKHFIKELVHNPETKQVVGGEEIKKAFTCQGVDLTKPITALCYNGVSACLVPLAAAEIGIHDVSVYLGSWTEYGQLADPSNVEVGSEVSNAAPGA